MGHSDLKRRDWLRYMLGVVVVTSQSIGAPASLCSALAQGGATMDPTQRNKLILLLRKHGTRGGLYSKVGSLLGIHNKGKNLPVSQMRVRKDSKILTFGRIGMRDRELYYWALQADVKILKTYIFLTNREFSLAARGVELKNADAVALEPARTTKIFAEVIHDWISILDAP